MTWAFLTIKFVSLLDFSLSVGKSFSTSSSLLVGLDEGFCCFAASAASLAYSSSSLFNLSIAYAAV
jgi:hypothetical protein